MEVNSDDSDTLDVLYSEYLTALRDVILQIESEEDINLCKQWLQVFNDSSREHKVARNCLIALLYQQLKTNETLEEPFTDLSNIGRDLESILRDLGIECDASSKRSLPDSDNFTSQQVNNDIENNEEQSSRYSSRSEQSLVPKNSFHIQQIDDLNTFFTNIRRTNETLHNEVRKLRKENELLQVKNEKANTEMQKLLDLFKGCTDYHVLSDESVIETTATVEKQSLIQIFANQNGETILQDIVREDDLRVIQIVEEEIFNVLNNLIQILKTSLLDENPLETFCKLNIVTFSQMFEKCSNISFLTKIALFEKNIQNLVTQLAEHVKTYYDSRLKPNEVNEEVKPVVHEVCSKASQTRNVTYKSSSEGPRHNADFKVKYLRKCLLKMQNSRDRVIEKYEYKLKEQVLQNRMQQKILKLKLASVSSKIFLRSNYKNQEELFELTNHLEAKYKDIIAEAIERMRDSI